VALFELGIGALLASTQKMFSRVPRKGSLKEYAFLGLLFLAARVLTNLSVRCHVAHDLVTLLGHSNHIFRKLKVEYMDYPTHVVVKSAKVVPMMIMGFFILGVRPTTKLEIPIFFSTCEIPFP
jgi:hypothetical protein